MSATVFYASPKEALHASPVIECTSDSQAANVSPDSFARMSEEFPFTYTYYGFVADSKTSPAARAKKNVSRSEH